MNKFEKQSNEKYAISIDFSNTLETTETIASFTLSVTDELGQSVTTSDVVDSSSNDNDSVEIVVKDGTNGKTYKLTAVTTSSLGYVYEEDVYMEIINI